MLKRSSQLGGAVRLASQGHLLSSAGSSQQPSCPFPHCTPKGSRRAGHYPLPGEAVGRRHECLTRPPRCNRKISSPPELSFCRCLYSSALQAGRREVAAGQQEPGYVPFPRSLSLSPLCLPLKGCGHRMVLATSLLASYSSLLLDRTLLWCRTLNKNDF